MSKKSKTRSAEKRKREKRARKKANQDRYQKWAEDGVNLKSKRSTRGKRKGPRATHRNVDCGNPGCMRCFEINFSPFINKHGVPTGMPHWMYLKYVAETGYTPANQLELERALSSTVSAL